MARHNDLLGQWSLTGYLPWDGEPDGPAILADPSCGAASLASLLGQDAGACAGEWMTRRRFRWERHFTLPEEPREGRSERYYLRLRVDGRGEVLLDGKSVGRFDGPWRLHEYDVTALLEGEGEHHIAVIIHEQPHARRLPTLRIYEAAVRSVAFGRIRSLQARGEDNMIRVRQRIEGFTAGRANFHYRVLLGDELVTSFDAQEKLMSCEQDFAHDIPIPNARPWRVNGRGEQPLYTVRLTIERGGTRCDGAQFTVGFPLFEMKPPYGAPGALPYALWEDGEQIAIQGVNVCEPVDAQALALLAAAGVNLIRFCGPLPPDDAAYAACASLGLLIWQELPLRGPGEPTGDVACARALALDAAARLATTPALAALSAGRDLLWPDGTPVGLLHPTIAAMHEEAEALCPHAVFFPASPSGPVYTPTPLDLGRGLRHDVHGPLVYDTENFHRDLAQTDALLLSRVGVPAAGDAVSRFLQAEALGYAAYSARRRAPGCAGLIAWHAQDECPSDQPSYALLCPDGTERPALYALRNAWGHVAASAAVERGYFLRGETLIADVRLHASPQDETLYSVQAQIADLRGHVLCERLFQSKGTLGGRCGELSLRLEADAPDCLLLLLRVYAGDTQVFSDCLTLPIPHEGENPIEPLTRLPTASPTMTVEEHAVHLANDASDAVVGLCLYAGPHLCYFGPLMPWEKRTIPLPAEYAAHTLRCEALNIQTITGGTRE